jgi:hypothetical protein
MDRLLKISPPFLFFKVFQIQTCEHPTQKTKTLYIYIIYKSEMPARPPSPAESDIWSDIAGFAEQAVTVASGAVGSLAVTVGLAEPWVAAVFFSSLAAVFFRHIRRVFFAFDLELVIVVFRCARVVVGLLTFLPACERDCVLLFCLFATTTTRCCCILLLLF